MLSGSSTTRSANPENLTTLVNSVEINLKFLCDIKTKVSLLRESLLGSCPSASGELNKSPEAPRGLVDVLSRLNVAVDVTQHEIMGDLVDIEKALAG